MIDGGIEGLDERDGGIDVEMTGGMEIWGSSDFFHNTRVPPFALDLIMGSSGSNLSCEEREYSYAEAIGRITRSMSQEYIWGSLRKMRSGWC